MVGYNVGGGGGSGGSSGSDYKNDTLKPEFALEGYTFHAGENNNQQVGKIKNFDGKAVSGAGNGSQSISAKDVVRHIPAGTYLAQDVKLESVVTEQITVRPTNDEQIVTRSDGKFISQVTIPEISYQSIIGDADYYFDYSSISHNPTGVVIWSDDEWTVGSKTRYVCIFALRANNDRGFRGGVTVLVEDGVMDNSSGEITSIEWRDPSSPGVRDGYIKVTMDNSYFSGNYTMRVFGY